jgi:hypothetical protein
LRQLDAGLLALKTELGEAFWRQTCVLVITEFGRTVRAHGTRGTDHGTATCAFIAGGAAAGGVVHASWPGLSSANLFEDRDLQPTLDLRSVTKGLLAGHLGLDTGGLANVFPGSETDAACRTSPCGISPIAIVPREPPLPQGFLFIRSDRRPCRRSRCLRAVAKVALVRNANAARKWSRGRDLACY